MINTLEGYKMTEEFPSLVFLEFLVFFYVVAHVEQQPEVLGLKFMLELVVEFLAFGLCSCYIWSKFL